MQQLAHPVPLLSQEAISIFIRVLVLCLVLLVFILIPHQVNVWVVMEVAIHALDHYLLNVCLVPVAICCLLITLVLLLAELVIIRAVMSVMFALLAVKVVLQGLFALLARMSMEFPTISTLQVVFWLVQMALTQ